jgi:hypothetical protein
MNEYKEFKFSRHLFFNTRLCCIIPLQLSGKLSNLPSIPERQTRSINLVLGQLSSYLYYR